MKRFIRANRNSYDKDRIEELANEIRSTDTWDDDVLKEFCDAAGLLKEYEKADGDTFESVVYKAADILDVDI